MRPRTTRPVLMSCSPTFRATSRRIVELDERQIGRVDLDHRHVGPLVRADGLGGKLAPVGEAHGHLIGVGHYVGVGEDVAVGIDDETRARAARRRYIAALPFPRSGNAEAAEEVVERIVRRELQPAGPCLRFLDRSEEHTSELQSLRYLVCRLLLEKKKKHTTQTTKRNPSC